MDVMDGLKQLPNESIDVIITSPPYFSQRDYGEHAIRIWGGNENCEHEWIEEPMSLTRDNRNFARGTQEEVHKTKPTIYIKKYDAKTAGFCNKCGAWKGQLGLEPSYKMYIDHLFEIFTECRRVLKRSGSFWLNIGDVHASGGTKRFDEKKTGNQEVYCGRGRTDELPEKCLAGIPWRLAIKMVDEGGWTLRNCVIWVKENPMPESVKDRLTNVYEYVFFFVRKDAKSSWYIPGNKPSKPELLDDWEKVRIWWDFGVKHKNEIPSGFLRHCTNLDYYFNLDMIREPFKEVTIERCKHSFNLNTKGREYKIHPESQRRFAGKIYKKLSDACLGCGKPLSKHAVRNTKYLGTRSPEMVGDPRLRVVKRPASVLKVEGVYVIPCNPYGKNPGDVWTLSTESLKYPHFAPFPSKLCERIIMVACPPKGVVLDPFCGSGTALVAAKKLKRSYIGFDVVPEYVEIARERLAEVPIFADLEEVLK
jgi:site-specific DNA-methyltransferase (adenine-specific)